MQGMWLQTIKQIIQLITGGGVTKLRIAANGETSISQDSLIVI